MRFTTSHRSGLALLASVLFVTTTIAAQVPTRLPIGTFDSRLVAVAYHRSPAGEEWMQVPGADIDKAKPPRVYIEAAETVDAGNAKDKAKHVDFGAAIAAALVKKQVPVLVVTDPTKAQWTIKAVSSQKEDSTGTKVAKMLFRSGSGFTKFEGTIQVIDNESSAVLFAFNVKKGDFQSAAESFAKHFKSDYLQKK